MEEPSSEYRHLHFLRDLCVYFGEESEEDTASDEEVNKFVGLKCINGKLRIYFPVGYMRPVCADETQYRREILNLVSVLSTFGEKSDMLGKANISASMQDVQFPIHAYLYIIGDFLNHGYFTQKETEYRKGSTGKICWSRTIKQVRSQVIGENAYYFNFVMRHTDYSQTELISQIHKYCVYECFSKIGYLFSSFVPIKPLIRFNKALFIAVIRHAAESTFNEGSLLLFKNMIDVISYLDKEDENNDFVFGTENFHHIWEALVDSVYGENDKDRFYPTVYWKLNGIPVPNSPSKYNVLRPDTIMVTGRGTDNQKIYVLDSKYYQYGFSKNPNNLPESSSVVKQLAYAQFIETQCTNGIRTSKIPPDICAHFKKDELYNAFIMPGVIKIEEKEPENIGYVSADYVFSRTDEVPDRKYYKIYGIIVDVQELMFHHIPKDKNVVNILAAAIEHPA